MQHRILSTIIATALSIAVCAQETCTIKGNIANTQLNDGSKVKQLRLTRTNEFGQTIEVAKAKVKKGNYTFTCPLAEDTPTLQYAITGFGEGKSLMFFVEAGEVSISTPDATQPEKSTVSGPPANDTYAKYMAIFCDEQRLVAEQVEALQKTNGTEWIETPEGKAEVKRIEAKEAINARSQAIRFLIDNNASPITPLVIEQSLFPVLSAAYAEQITKAMAVSLHDHPYYHSLHNTMLANTLKVGSEAPDLTLPLLSGETKHLNDYRGKHIILNYWTSNCDKSAEMLAEMKNVYEVIKSHPGQFVIISVSLDEDTNAWRTAVDNAGIGLEGWLHACDGQGYNSLAAKRYKVDKAPKIILIEPEGHAVSLNMEVDEMVMRVEQILDGDLYYLDMKE